MEETNNRKNKFLMFIGILTLFLVIGGASYAYFAVSTINNFGTTTINAVAGEIGSVTLNGSNAQLNLSVTALDMAQGSNDITYYASSSGTTTTETEEVIGTATVTPNTDTTIYHCTYTLSVTHTGTNDMYTAFTNGANKSAGQIILTINGIDYDFYNGWPTNNQVQGEFYTTASNPAYITAGLRMINDSEINQNYLANTDIQISIALKNNSLSCTAVDNTIRFVNRQNANSIALNDELAIASEHFYVVSSDSTSTVLLSKYNLLVGDIYNSDQNWNYTLNKTLTSSDIGYGLQSSTAKGHISETNTFVGTVAFSGTNYWDDSVCQYTGTSWSCTENNGLSSGYTGSYSGNPYPYVYKSDMSSIAPSLVYGQSGTAAGWGHAQNNGYTIAYYVEEYVNKLKELGAPDTIQGRLLTSEEAISLGCSSSSWSCLNTVYPWLYSSSYWTGSAAPRNYAIWTVMSSGVFVNRDYSAGQGSGVRPVIVIPTSDIPS